MTLPDSKLLQLRGLTKKYTRHTTALDGVDLAVQPGELVAIIGPSGAGKSTLLRCINRLVEPTAGQILFDHKDVTTQNTRELRALRTRIGMIFQHHNLIGSTSVLHNAAHGRLGEVPFYRSLFGLYPADDMAEARALLATVGLADFAHNRADTLSGGQAQRVGICRALMQRPKLLLADEPIASLDPASSHTVMQCLKNAVQERGIGCLVNLHQVDFAREYATRIVGLRDGRVVFDDAPDALTDDIVDIIYSDAAPAMTRTEAAPPTYNTFDFYRQGIKKAAIGFCLLAAVIASFIYIGVNPLQVFTGFPRFVQFFYANFLPPNTDYVRNDFSIIWARVLDTLFFAVVGTYISAGLAFFLGLGMSREMNRIAPLRGAIRFFVSFVRNVPLLVWATMLIFIFGIGAMLGVVALVLATLGFLARSYADAMDEIAATRLEALRATGAGWWQVLFHGLVPSFVPAWINWTLFSFEINIRASAVLGMVGAGGLGFLIQSNLDLRGFRRAMALIFILMFMVLATEFLMNLARRKLAQAKARRGQSVLLALAAVGLFFFSVQRLGLDIATFLSRARNTGAVLARFWAFNPSALPEIFRQLLISVAIGVSALAVSFVLSMVLAFLAADNIAPSRYLGYAIKGAVGLIRAVPSLVLILMVVASLGFGPVAAVVGLVFTGMGYLTRAFIATIEEQDRAIIDAMRTTGASRLQIILHGLLPGVFTAFVAWLAIRLEANIADSVSLGIVGAGGVGMLISRAVRQANDANLTTTIVVIVGAMLLLEAGVQWVKRRV